MRQGVKYQKNFTLREYKTWGAAEKAAESWVKRTVSKLPEKKIMKGKTQEMTSRNTSGVVGVRLVSSVKYKNGKAYENWRWVASWPGCAYKGGISWSVPRYGDNEAFVLSVLAREMRTIDREKLMAKLKRIKGKKSYSKILDLKQLKLELA